MQKKQKYAEELRRQQDENSRLSGFKNKMTRTEKKINYDNLQV